MNRLFARLLTLLLWPMLLLGQTAATKPATTTTAQPTPTQPVVLTIPKNGGKVSFQLSPQNIPPLPVNIPPLPLATPITATISCQLSATGSFIVNPDKSITVTGLVCSMVTQ